MLVNKLWQTAQHMAGLADTDPFAPMFRYSSTTVRSHASAGAGAAASTSSAGTSSGNTDGHDDSPLAYQPLAYLRLQYVLQWPMGVVISSEALSKYDRLHSFLLCHRHASKTLH